MQRDSRFLFAVLLLVVFAAIRSLVATRLDGFTIDEPYHINSGVAYVERGDFRLNPEQPPLVKLWVGAAVAPAYELPPFRPIDGKLDERDFHESAMFLGNDADAVQRRTRMAMVALHMLALAWLAFAIRRVLGAPIALGALAFLVIDPTVAAHMPVAMMDLPAALFGAIALFTAIVAFRTWHPLDLAVASLALGLALGAKHNMILVAVFVAILGLTRRRVVPLLAMLLGAVVLLWAMYGFQYHETKPGVETFNKPLATKIADLRSPLLRNVVQVTADAHLLPRSYLWGLADILRAGVEGRAYPFAAFGKTFIGRTPWYYFPGAVLVKVPLGLLALAIAGAIIAFRARERATLRIVAMYGLAFLASLMNANSGYAGVRHALPLFPILAVFAGVAVAETWERRRDVRWLVPATAALAAAAIAALPAIRPWGFFNTIAGSENAWQRFADEGQDLGQRTPEIAAFYHAHIARSGLAAYDQYGILSRELERRRLRIKSWMEPLPGNSSRMEGWFFFNASDFAVDAPWMDLTPFRRTRPVARFGDVVVYRGSFDLPWARSLNNYVAAVVQLHGPKPDLAKIEAELEEAVRLNPRAYPMQISLGNLRAKRGKREEAIRAFLDAKGSLIEGDPLVAQIDEHVARLRREQPQKVAELTNPWAE